MKNNEYYYVYPAIFEKDDEGSAYGIYFPDFERCYTSGEGIQGALSMARERLGIEIELYQEEKRALPKPSEVEDIEKPANGFTSLVDVDMIKYKQIYDTAFVRKNCTVQKWLSDWAEESKVNFSATLQEALKNKWEHSQKV